MPGSSPRFRVRFDDGSELPIDSVAGLARRLTRGDILPGTEIFDAGTGVWGHAAGSPIVRFILDELLRDGFSLPSEWEGVHASGDTGPPDEPGDGPPDPAPVDPLDLKLTVSPHVDVEEAKDVPEHPAEPSPRAPRAEPRAPKDRDWVTPSSEGGLLAEQREREGGAVSDVEGPGPGRGGAGAHPGIRTKRRERRSWLVGGAVVTGAFIVLFGIAQLNDRTDGTAPTFVAAGPEQVSVPEGLETAAEAAVSRLAGRMLAVADSVRAAHGLARTPPDGWLSGRYLASADSFPSVRRFWETYGEFLGDLGSVEGDQVRDLLAEQAADAPSGREEDLLDYLEARYQAAIPGRTELFDQLELATRQALELHDYLVAETPHIRHTPAVGTNEVPRDPVLEIASDSARILEGLGDRMDALFEALDRSRGGGAPEMTGLEADLFRGFGLF